MESPGRDLPYAAAASDAWPDVTIGVIAALTIEGAAMRTLMAGPRAVRVPDDPHDYRIGHLDSAEAGRPHRVALVTLTDDNTRNAAATCTDMLRSFPHIRCVIMAGVAGGVPAPENPARHVRLGDVVVAIGGIVDYGHVRQGPRGPEQRRPITGSMSADLKRVAQRLEEDQILGVGIDWVRWLTPPDDRPMAVFARPPQSADQLHRGKQEIPHPDPARSGHPAGFPKVHFGSVGSADVLMRSGETRDAMAAEHGVLAFEMETAGIAAGVADRGVNWFVVRGIVDYCDEYKNDVWHPYGSLVAAAGVRALLAQCPPFRVWRVDPDGARTLLPDHEMARLQDLLDQVPDVDGHVVWEAAVGNLLSPPDGLASLAGLATLLARHNAGPDRIPPLVAFTEHVAARAPHRLAGQLRAWADRVARSTLHVHDRLATFRQSLERSARAGGDGQRPPIRPCLLIQIERDGIESGSYQVRYWIQRRPARWDPEPTDPRRATFRELERVLEAAIQHAESAWHDLDDAPVEIELLLSADLLHTPVEWWQTELDAPGTTPLCLEYRVVVRSLERMKEGHRRRLWNNRWRSLWQNPSRHHVHWGRPDSGAVGLDQWNARLREDHRLTTVVLGSSPEDESGRQELQLALRAGIPVILWDHRRGALTAEMTGLLDGLTAESPDNFGDRVHALRRDAGLLAPHARAGHPGRHLAVLWDDPERNVFDLGEQP